MFEPEDQEGVDTLIEDILADSGAFPFHQLLPFLSKVLHEETPNNFGNVSKVQLSVMPLWGRERLFPDFQIPLPLRCAKRPSVISMS